MPKVSSPYLVRDENELAVPGVHTYNRTRRATPAQVRRFQLRGIRLALLVLGLAGTGYYAYTVADESVYQAYENWSFDAQIGGRSQVTFADYLRERTPFGKLLGATETTVRPALRPALTMALRPPHGSILGRVSVDRLGISAMVREGVDAGTLSKAVGHVPATALPGQLGNFAIAAHRDTLFRALRNVRVGDRVTFQSALATYTYQVIALQIVRPSDVSVLRTDGGPRLLQAIHSRPAKLLTMITCYPFNYVGSAPQRFIVQAAAIDPVLAPARSAATAAPSLRTRGRRRAVALVLSTRTQMKPQKHGFWHKLFSLG